MRKEQRREGGFTKYIGPEIKRRRIERGISQAELVRRIGKIIKPSTLSMVETSERSTRCNLETIDIIAQELGCDIIDIITRAKVIAELERQERQKKDIKRKRRKISKKPIII